MDKTEIFQKMRRIAEEYFGTATDPEQIPIVKASADKLFSIHKDTIVYRLDEKGEPIAWVVAIPTSVRTMNDFLEKRISERELLDRAVAEKSFEAIYLCAAFTLPEYRKRGCAKELLKEAIGKLGGERVKLYAWIYSDEGKKVVDGLSRDLGCPIFEREG